MRQHNVIIFIIVNIKSTICLILRKVYAFSIKTIKSRKIAKASSCQWQWCLRSAQNSNIVECLHLFDHFTDWFESVPIMDFFYWYQCYCLRMGLAMSHYSTMHGVSSRMEQIYFFGTLNYQSIGYVRSTFCYFWGRFSHF